MRKQLVILSLSALLLNGLQSCVTDNYDLSKDVETKLTFSPSGFTLGGENSGSIPLRQIMDLSENGQLTTLANGDYLFSKKADDVSPSTLQVSGNHKICGATQESSTVALHIVSGERENAYNIPVQCSVVPTFPTTMQDKSIKDLSYVETDMTLNISLTFNNISADNITDASRLRITLPAYYTVSDESELTIGKSDFVKTGSAQFKVNRDIRISGVDFKATSLAAGDAISFSADTHEITLKGGFHVDGNLEITTGGNNSTGTASLSMTAKVGDVNATSATGLFYKEVSLNINPIHLNNIPGFLKGEEIVLDLYNPILKFTLENEASADVLANFTLVSMRNGQRISTVTVGDENGTDAVRFAAANGSEKTISTVWISRRALSAGELPEGTSNVVVPNLSSLVETIPDYIQLEGVSVKTDDTKEVTIELARVYTEQPSYAFEAPLTIGANINIVYTEEAEDIHDDVKDVEVETVVVTADVQNNIPLNISIAITPYDSNGQILNDIEVTNPEAVVGLSSGKIECILKNKEGISENAIRKLDRLSFKATGNIKDAPSLVGETLNENQNLRLDNVKLTLKSKAE